MATHTRLPVIDADVHVIETERTGTIGTRDRTQAHAAWQGIHINTPIYSE